MMVIKVRLNVLNNKPKAMQEQLKENQRSIWWMNTWNTELGVVKQKALKSG